MRMGFFKKRQQKANGLWYPQSVTVGNVGMEKIIDRLAQISTVSKSDVQAVLGDLASVMADYMSLGYTVKLDGLGTFYFTAVTNKQGVATAEEVSAKQITGVRVRFLPESERSSDNKRVTRALSNVDITWKEVDGNKIPVDDGSTTEPEGPGNGEGTLG